MRVSLILSVFLALASCLAPGHCTEAEPVTRDHGAVAIDGDDVLASEELIPGPRLGALGRALRQRAQLAKERAAYQRRQAKLYRRLARTAKSHRTRKAADMKRFVARTSAMRNKARAMVARHILRKNSAYTRWRKRVRAIKRYNRVRGYRGKRFDIRPCLRLCRSVHDRSCYRGCYRMAFKRVLLLEQRRMIALYPRDARYVRCAKRSYDFEAVRTAVIAKRERKSGLAGTAALGVSSRLLDSDDAAPGDADAGASPGIERVYVHGEDPSWSRIAHESMEKTIREAVPAVDALEDGADALLSARAARVGRKRRWSRHWAKVRRHRAAAHWANEQIRALRRDAHRGRQDAARRAAALRRAARRARLINARGQVRRELRARALRRKLGRVSARRAREIRRVGDAAALRRRAALRAARRESRRRLAIRRRVTNRAAREIEANAMRVEHLRARELGYRNQHELNGYLHVARGFNEHCLRAAQRRAQDSARRTGRAAGAGRGRAPPSPVKDKKLIYQMTMGVAQQMIRRWLLFFRGMKHHYLQSTRAARNARRKLGDDDEIPGHMERNGQGAPHWLFEQGLANPSPDDIAVSKFGHNTLKKV